MGPLIWPVKMYLWPHAQPKRRSAWAYNQSWQSTWGLAVMQAFFCFGFPLTATVLILNNRCKHCHAFMHMSEGTQPTAMAHGWVILSIKRKQESRLVVNKLWNKNKSMTSINTHISYYNPDTYHTSYIHSKKVHPKNNKRRFYIIMCSFLSGHE